MKVLLVEDSSTQATLLKSMFAIFDSGVTGLTISRTIKDALIEQATVDVVILDLTLYGTGPEDTITHIPEFKKPVFVLTSLLDKQLIRAAAKAGAAAYLIKGTMAENVIAAAEFHKQRTGI